MKLSSFNLWYLSHLVLTWIPKLSSIDENITTMSTFPRHCTSFNMNNGGNIFFLKYNTLNVHNVEKYRDIDEYIWISKIFLKTFTKYPKTVGRFSFEGKNVNATEIHDFIIMPWGMPIQLYSTEWHRVNQSQNIKKKKGNWMKLTLCKPLPIPLVYSPHTHTLYLSLSSSLSLLGLRKSRTEVECHWS